MEPIIRYRTITYLTFGMAMVWLCSKMSASALAFASPRADRILVGNLHISGGLGFVLGIGVTWFAWSNARSHQWVTEVVTELSKVTWPSKDETRKSMWVVIGFSVMTAVLLAAFDFVWKFATDLIL